MNWRAFKENGLRALAAKIKEMADSSMSAVSELGADLVGLAEQTGAALDGKQEKAAAVSFTIPVSGWQQDGTADYPYYYDLRVSGVTARDRADVAVAPAEIRTAADCGLCPGTETLEGKIRLRAASVPAKSIAAVYWLEQGKE